MDIWWKRLLHKRNNQSSDFQSVVSGDCIIWELDRTEILSFYLRSVELGALEMGPSNLYLTSPSVDSATC